MKKQKKAGLRKRICYNHAKIFALIASGYSLNQISKMSGMPGNSYLYDRLAKDADFAEKYAQAREIRADRIFEEILQIADDSSEDYQETKNGTALNREAIERGRLRIDARKWMLARMSPKKYGDKTETEFSGGIGLDRDFDIIIENN